jgi:hypothetical protein
MEYQSAVMYVLRTLCGTVVELYNCRKSYIYFDAYFILINQFKEILLSGIKNLVELLCVLTAMVYKMLSLCISIMSWRHIGDILHLGRTQMRASCSRDFTSQGKRPCYPLDRRLVRSHSQYMVAERKFLMYWELDPNHPAYKQLLLSSCSVS